MGCFTLEATDGAARAGVIHTAHGEIRTPAFMPVGTKGTVKTLLPDEVRSLGADVILGNTYHLHFRPGEDVIEEVGGLHAFTGWGGPILTDSGGFQVFSLRDTLARGRRRGRDVPLRLRREHREAHAGERRRDPAAARLGHRDVPRHLPARGRLRPRARGGGPAHAALGRAPGRCAAGARDSSGSGSPRAGLTRSCGHARSRGSSGSRSTASRSEGWRWGRAASRMLDTVAWAAPALPADRPRYFMGLGDAEGILEVIARGVDMFDCVLPTRTARTGSALTARGRLNLRNARFARDPRPLEAGCGCTGVRLLAGLRPPPRESAGAPRPAPPHPA